MTLSTFLIVVSALSLWISYDQTRRLAKLYGKYIPDFMEKAEAPNAKAVLAGKDYGDMGNQLQLYGLRAALFLAFVIIALISNTIALYKYPDFSNPILQTFFVLSNAYIFANIFLARSTFNYVYNCESRITAMVIEDKAAKFAGKDRATTQDIVDYLAHENEELQKEMMEDAQFDEQDTQEPPEK